VGVTGYDSFVPAAGPSTKVVAKDCSFGTKTIALTFGQQIDVINKGPAAVSPNLLGDRGGVLLISIPGGDPVTLFPSAVGQFVLVDESHPHAFADVFVLRFSTFDVTGLDGRFEVDRLPPGELKVSAYLPTTRQTVMKTVTVEAGQTVELELEIPFDAKEHPFQDSLERLQR
jgi:hypothetical protein